MRIVERVTDAPDGLNFVHRANAGELAPDVADVHVNGSVRDIMPIASAESLRDGVARHRASGPAREHAKHHPIRRPKRQAGEINLGRLRRQFRNAKPQFGDFLGQPPGFGAKVRDGAEIAHVRSREATPPRVERVGWVGVGHGAATGERERVIARAGCRL